MRRDGSCHTPGSRCKGLHDMLPIRPKAWDKHGHAEGTSGSQQCGRRHASLHSLRFARLSTNAPASVSRLRGRRAVALVLLQPDPSPHHHQPFWFGRKGLVVCEGAREDRSRFHRAMCRIICIVTILTMITYHPRVLDGWIESEQPFAGSLPPVFPSPRLFNAPRLSRGIKTFNQPEAPTHARKDLP